MNIDNSDDFSDYIPEQDREYHEQRNKNYEDEQSYSFISMYSLGLYDSDFF